MTMLVITQLLRGIDALAGAVAGAALRWTAVVLVTWLAAWLLRRGAAAFRHALWATALLALPLLLVAEATPRWELPLAGTARWSHAAQRVSLRAATSEAAAHDALASPGEGTPATATPAAPARPLTLLWLTGVALALARELAQARATRRLLRGAERVDAAPSGASGDVVAWSAAVPVPALVGAWRARLLLPRGWQKWPRRWQEAALAHERMHVRRGDLRWQLLVRALRPLFWFHPGFWLAARRLRAAAEMACDEAVVRSGLDGVDYAQTLVAIAAAARPPIAAGVLAVTGETGTLTSRVRWLLAGDPATRRRPRRGWLVALVALALLLATVDLAPATDDLSRLPLRALDGARGWALRCADGDGACTQTTAAVVRLLTATRAGGVVLVSRVEDGRLEAYATLDRKEASEPVPRLLPGSLAKTALVAAWWEAGMGDPLLPCAATARTPSGLVVSRVGASAKPGLTPNDVLVYSCNTAAVEMATALERRFGDERLPSALVPLLADAAHPPAAIDWPAQAAGIGPLTTTPLAVARWIQAVGNDGMGTEPWVTGGVAPAAQRLLSARTAARLRQAFADVVQRGTAREGATALAGTTLHLGGKTATVQRPDGSTDGWFAGLVTDGPGRPRHVVVVWLRGSGSGGHAPTLLAARLAPALAR